MENIINLNLSQDLIEAACLQALKAARGNFDLSNCAIVFGGKRPAYFAKEYLFEKLKAPFLPPKFFSVDELMWQSANYATNCSAISQIDCAYAIYEAAKECAPVLLHERESFSAFLPWALEIHSFIEELEIELVPQDLLLKLSASADIGFEGSAKVNKLLTHIAVLKQRCQDKYKEKNKFTKAMSYSFCANESEIGLLSGFDKIIFAGLFSLHKSEQLFIKKIYSSGKAVLIFQGSATKWAALEKNAKSFACKIEPQINDKLPKPKLICATDSYSQAVLANYVLSAYGKLTSKSALILPDSSSLMPVLSEVASSAKELNVSCGYPLRRTPFYSMAQSIIELLCSVKGGECRAKLYVIAISHPLIKSFYSNTSNGALTRIVVHKIEEALCGKISLQSSGKLFIEPKNFQHEAVLLNKIAQTYSAMGLGITLEKISGLIEFINNVVYYNWSKAQTLFDLCCAYETLIKELSEKSKFLSYPQNIKAAEQLYDYLDELKMSLCANVQMPQEQLYAMFLSLLESKTVSFSGTPLKGLQVLGFLESRLINFENIVMVDVNEDVLPNVNSVEPLIPAQMRALLKLKSKEDEEEIARYHFTRTIAGAKNATLIYIEDAEHERSRFIEQMLWAFEKEKGALIEDSAERRFFSVKTISKKGAIEKTKEVCDFLLAKKFSASALDRYLQCPKSFYFHYVLGLKEKDDIGENFDNSELGTFVHKFLQDEFNKFVGTKPVIDSVFCSEFESDFEKYFKENIKGKVGPEAFLLQHVLSAKLKLFLNTEKDRAVERIEELEKNIDFNMALAGKNYAFSARIDRIDKVVDGSYLILDYKTGALKPLPSTNKDISVGTTRAEIQKYIKSFQLPIYIFALKGCCNNSEIDAALWNLKENKIDRLFNDIDNKDKNELLLKYQNALGIILKEITNEDVPFEADASVCAICENCPYKAMC